MAPGKLMQILLGCLFIIGAVINFLLFMRQNSTPKVKDKCSDELQWCNSVETAKACGVLEFCHLKWRTATSGNETESAAADIDKSVSVGIYYESLCPDSEKFIIEQLYPTYEKLFGKKIFNAELIPYGNAEESKKGDRWEFECQHGEDECIGNVIETCAIHELKNVTLWMPFVLCMEKHMATVDAAKQCSKDLQIEYDPIEKCRTGKIGNELQHQMALKTNALKPKHTFIPWITINGKSEGLQTKALYNFFELVCDMYEGPKPDICTK